MNKNIRIVFICIMFIFTGISSGIGLNINDITYEISILNRDILYVGGSGPNNYTNIQNAIDDASNGDTVFVFSGEYNELIYINTTLSLIGENRHNTIINGSEIGTIITINADYVNASDFTIKEGSFYKYAIEVKSDYNNISNNIFLDNGKGLYIFNNDNNTITGNVFSRHDSSCILIEYSNNSIVSSNTFNNNDPGNAISIVYSSLCIISENHITTTSDGIRALYCDNIIITNNTLIRDTFKDAIYMYYTNYSTISNNDILSWERGLWLENCNYNNIFDNKMFDNYYEGIFILKDNNYNIISNNNIAENERGIFMYTTSQRNIIYNNNISLNSYGINIRNHPSNNNNSMYHNNFIDNNVNALDGGSNIWNDSYPSGGNYWDDYTGNDSDGDGIGDTERNISGGGGNKDYYPLMYPWGEQRPVANYTYFEEFGGYVFDASLSYDRDGDVVSFEWDFGDGIIDSGMVVSHAYNDSGEYDVTLTITDDEGCKGNHTKTIDAVQNYPPDTPSIEGPSSGGWGKPYHFTFQSLDNEGSDVWYFVEWGDSKDTGWMGPYVSGYEITDSHTWTEQETFTIRCKAKDMYNVHSDWAEFEITIPRTRTLSFHWLIDRFPLLERLLFFIGINI